ncbi:MAG: GatB/YqeY domain-containing protein [Candidatus Omnitrophota bacterium]
MAKQRDDSIEQFRKGNRDDLADKEQKELEILSAYLPKQLTAEEITPVIEKIIQETGAGSKADMGRVMKAVISELGGRADGKIISRIVGALLK